MDICTCICSSLAVTAVAHVIYRKKIKHPSWCCIWGHWLVFWTLSVIIIVVWSYVWETHSFSWSECCVRPVYLCTLYLWTPNGAQDVIYLYVPNKAEPIFSKVNKKTNSTLMLKAFTLVQKIEGSYCCRISCKWNKFPLWCIVMFDCVVYQLPLLWHPTHSH